LTFALDLINHARRRKGTAELRPSTALTDALQSLIGSIDMESALYHAASLSSELSPATLQRRKSIAIIAAGCGGCGAQPAASNIRFLLQQWLDIQSTVGRCSRLALRTLASQSVSTVKAAKLLSPRSAFPLTDKGFTPWRVLSSVAPRALWPNPICSANSDRPRRIAGRHHGVVGGQASLLSVLLSLG
jgi:hypothetical protein